MLLLWRVLASELGRCTDRKQSRPYRVTGHAAKGLADIHDIGKAFLFVLPASRNAPCIDAQESAKANDRNPVAPHRGGALMRIRKASSTMLRV